MRLERFLNTLGTIALVTRCSACSAVFGMIRMFFAVMVSGVGDPLKMAGIGEALVCTASGLCVAIRRILPPLFPWRVTELVIDMEKQVMALTDELTIAGETRAAG